MILIESIFMMYIKNLFLIIFLVTLSNCSSKNQFSYFADEPIYKNPDGEFEGFVIDYLYDNLVVYSYTLPIEEKNYTIKQFLVLFQMKITEKFMNGKQINILEGLRF